jgi:hypothetical protein
MPRTKQQFPHFENLPEQEGVFQMAANPSEPMAPEVTRHRLTPAERQRQSRAERKAKTWETFPAKQISLLLSAEASQALVMLSRDVSQKEVIERLLSEAYREERDRPEGGK